LPSEATGVFAIEHGRFVEVVTNRDLVGVDPLWPHDQELSPFGIAFDNKGDLFLYTTDPYAVLARQPNGTFRYVGLAGRPQPTNPFVASGDSLYLSGNYGIVGFSPDISSAPRTAAPQTTLMTGGRGHFPDNQFLNPAGIAATASGDVIIDGDLYGAPRDASGTHAVLVEVAPSGKIIMLGEWGGSTSADRR
jgi:hypothetical protein